MPTDTQLPASYDIELVRGDDYVLDVEVEEDGVKVDFSVWSAEELQVRTGPGGELLGEYSTAEGDLTTTSQGRVTVTLPSAATTDWPHQVQYDLQGTDAEGHQRTLLAGTITVRDEITA